MELIIRLALTYQKRGNDKIWMYFNYYKILGSDKETHGIVLQHRIYQYREHGVKYAVYHLTKCDTRKHVSVLPLNVCGLDDLH
jgi:hypothetical protein